MWLRVKLDQAYDFIEELRDGPSRDVRALSAGVGPMEVRGRFGWGQDNDGGALTAIPTHLRLPISGAAVPLHRALSLLLESGRAVLGRSEDVIGWAVRWVLLWCGIVLLGIGILDRGAALLPDRAPPTGSGMPVVGAARTTVGVVSNTIVFAGNEQGHVVLDAAVNGAPVRMLVDTGASLVTLTQEDARAVGIARAGLAFNGRVSTANGFARMAPVTLREIRIGQLSIYDVPAAVLENLNISLLGMSFLSRLQSYEMRDGKLTISW